MSCLRNVCLSHCRLAKRLAPQFPGRAVQARYSGDLSTYVSEVAIMGTGDIPLLQKALRAQGYAEVPGCNTRGLHPFTIALAEGTFNVWGIESSGVLCLLRWPRPESVTSMQLPLVLMERGSRHMQLVSRSIREYVTRLLVEEDIRAGEDGEHTLADALGKPGKGLYIPGNIRSFKYSKHEAFYIKEVGHFPDVSKRLLQAHVDKGDTVAAMVTAEWTMKNFFYERWALPFEEAAWLYEALGRGEEARDTARLALKQPWWTTSALNRVRGLAQMTGTVSDAYALFNQQRRGDGTYASVADQLTPRDAAEQDANMLMDQVADGEVDSWDEIRPELARCLQQAGCDDVAKFIHTSTLMAN